MQLIVSDKIDWSSSNNDFTGRILGMDLSDCNLTSLPDDFDKLTQLKQLKLTNNTFNNLDYSILCKMNDLQVDIIDVTDFDFSEECNNK